MEGRREHDFLHGSRDLEERTAVGDRRFRGGRRRRDALPAGAFDRLEGDREHALVDGKSRDCAAVEGDHQEAKVGVGLRNIVEAEFAFVGVAGELVARSVEARF